jgi:hypothetical protein
MNSLRLRISHIPAPPLLPVPFPSAKAGKPVAQGESSSLVVSVVILLLACAFASFLLGSAKVLPSRTVSQDRGRTGSANLRPSPCLPR